MSSARTSGSTRSAPPPSRTAARHRRRVWLTYSEDKATRPLLWELSRRFPLQFNIRSASILNGIGVAGLELEGAPRDLDAASAWLRRQGVHVEPVEFSEVEGA